MESTVENLSVEDVKKLSNIQLAKKLAKLADYKLTDSVVIDGGYAEKNGQCIRITSFCVDLNAIALVEKVVLEKGLQKDYCNLLGQIAVPISEAIHSRTERWLPYMITASARKRAEACYLALSNLSENQL